jgi:acetyl-CoA carboxylase biotin carboxyl carrier protein
MTVDLRKVRKLIELVEESGITELEVRDGDETIRIARNGGVQLPAAPSRAVAPAAGDANAPGGVAPSPGSGGPTAGGAHPERAGFELRSPMAGTFYRAPAPEADPYVTIGQTVEPGDVLCIIESMKMMNELTAERPGVCVAVEVENGEAIGSGQTLFRFE